MTEFTNYYVNQVWTGITGYSVIRYQKGHGFFGKILSSAVLPILKYLGKKALSTGVSVGADVLQDENLEKRWKNVKIQLDWILLKMPLKNYGIINKVELVKEEELHTKQKH